jgi:ABC-type Fe3+-siderophore transport system permease subunit
MFRPLLFASVDSDVAEARGVPVKLLSILFMVVLAISVSEAVQVVGVLLIFALLVTPRRLPSGLRRVQAWPLPSPYCSLCFLPGWDFLYRFICRIRSVFSLRP